MIRTEHAYARVALVFSLIAVALGTWAAVASLSRPADPYTEVCNVTASTPDNAATDWFPCTAARPAP